MSFDYPALLLALIAFAPLAAADRLSARRRRVAESMPAGMRARLSASTLLFRLSMALLIAALAGPRWGEGPAGGGEYCRAMDVVFAVDISRSMEVPDGLGEYLGPGGAPTRLDRGIELAREAVDALPGARFAVAISRGRGVLAVPLTWDTGAVTTFLDALEGSAITGWGTNLEALVDAAAGAFQPSPPSRRAVVLVSDGEELSGSVRAAAGRLRQEGISLVALTVGSAQGGTFPGGGDVTSRRESAPVQAAVAQAGGLYIDGSRPDAGRQLSAHLSALAAGAAIQGAGGGAGAEPRARWQVFAALSLLAFGASKLCLLGSGRRGRESE